MTDKNTAAIFLKVHQSARVCVKLHWAGQNKFSTDYDSFKLFKVSYQFHLVMTLILFSHSYAPRYILSQCEFSYTFVYVMLVVAMVSVGGWPQVQSLSLCARFFFSFFFYPAKSWVNAAEGNPMLLDHKRLLFNLLTAGRLSIPVRLSLSLCVSLELTLNLSYTSINTNWSPENNNKPYGFCGR